MTETIRIKRTGNPAPSEIAFPEDIVSEIDSRLSKVKGKVFFITDDNVYRVYGKKSLLSGREVITFHPGESEKTLETVAGIERRLISLGANRDSFIVGIGGGIVTDVAGFVASTFMRGVGFGFVPTTLLAMVDASIGGKNGVNLDGYKNIVGNFRQPDWVLINRSFLETLPARENNAGMAEVLKYALIYDRDMFERLYSGEYDLTDLIARSVGIKAAIVEQDEKESGLRKVLNFGHTMGHAIEKCSAGRYLHGEAVAIGICYACSLSFNLGLLTAEDLERIEKTVRSLSLPTEPEGLDTDEVFEAMGHDKKSTGKDGLIDEVLLDGIGDFRLVRMDPSKLI